MLSTEWPSEMWPNIGLNTIPPRIEPVSDLDEENFDDFDEEDFDDDFDDDFEEEEDDFDYGAQELEKDDPVEEDLDEAD